MDTKTISESMELFGKLRGTNMLLDIREEIKAEIDKVAGTVFIGDEITYCEKKSYLEGLNKAMEMINNKIHNLSTTKTEQNHED